MSQISLKSIIGITSITTPSGVDNQFTVHTSDTTQRFKIDSAGQVHLSEGLNASGVVTATQFKGDGSELSNLPAGLGTALSNNQSSPLNKMYYTNQVLGVPSTITVDVPTSAQTAYTQYADIKVESSADLIIAEGDDLIPDVLGLADFGTLGGGPSAGRMRVNTITNASANGAPTVQNGLNIVGVTTAVNIDVGSNIKLGNAGVITATTVNATSFIGNGAQLTGIVGGKFNGPAAGILTTSSVGIQTNDVTSANLVGAATSMVGLYIGDGHLLFSNYLNKSGGYYITTGLNALNAGPVTLGTPMTLDGTWTIV